MPPAGKSAWHSLSRLGALLGVFLLAGGVFFLLLGMAYIIIKSVR
jgi:hypothetical protein